MTLRSSRITARKSSSVSRCIERRRLPSKSGESGRRLRSSRRSSHCPAKLSTSASARGSASIRRTCRSSVPPFRSAPRRARSSSSSSGMLLQRKKERREASSTSPSGNAFPGATFAGSRSNLKRNCGSTSTRATARRMPASNDARRAPGGVGVEQRAHLRPVGRHGTPIRARGQRVQDLGRARGFVGRRGGRADEEPPAARRVAGPGRVEGARDRDLRDARRSRVHVVDAVGAAAVAPHQRRGRDRAGARGDAQARRAASLQRHARAVDGDIQIVDARARARRPAEARPARLAHLDVVLGVEREGVPDDDAAARAQRQAVDVGVLRDVAGHPVRGAIEPDRGGSPTASRLTRAAAAT